MKWIGLLLWLPLLLSACSLGTDTTMPCQPPEGFAEADLVGTWASIQKIDFGGDTLVIREDGLYKQTIDIKMPDFHYESDWQPWRVEYSENGVVYLHLTGMRLYAFNPNLIEEGVVGGGDAWFVDFCSGPVVMPDGKEVYPGVQMPPGEGVLVVQSVPKRFVQPPRGFHLSLLPVSDVSGWSYELQEP